MAFLSLIAYFDWLFIPSWLILVPYFPLGLYFPLMAYFSPHCLFFPQLISVRSALVLPWGVWQCGGSLRFVIVAQSRYQISLPFICFHWRIELQTTGKHSSRLPRPPPPHLVVVWQCSRTSDVVPVVIVLFLLIIVAFVLKGTSVFALYVYLASHSPYPS